MSFGPHSPPFPFTQKKQMDALLDSNIYKMIISFFVFNFLYYLIQILHIHYSDPYDTKCKAELYPLAHLF